MIPDHLPAVLRPADSEWEWLEVTALLHDDVEWLRAAVGVEPLVEQPALAPELADPASHYDGERAVMFLASVGPVAAGTAAVRFHDDGSAELKRMYLRPIARGRGLADLLVARAVDAATERGCPNLWLESLPGVMEPALAVYRRHGFQALAGGGRTIPVEGIVTMERLLPQRCKAS